MYTFNLKLADYVIQANVNYQTTRKYCSNYLTNDFPDYIVAVNMGDIEKERLLSEKSDVEAGRSIVLYSDEYLETLALYRKIVTVLFPNDVILFHGSAVSIDGQCVLFAAPSGTGKSTHVRLWSSVLSSFGHEVYVINDDKPLLKFEGHHILASGTPWDGKHRLSNNIMIPIKAIVHLSRSEINHIERLDSVKAFPFLFSQAYRFSEPWKLEKTLGLIDQLSRETDQYQLFCNMDPEAAIIAYNGIFGGMKNETE